MAGAIYAGARANGAEARRGRRSNHRDSARTGRALRLARDAGPARESCSLSKPGRLYENVTAVEKGLAEGDQVIMSNYYRLQPDKPIKTDAKPVAVNVAGGRS